MPKRRGRPPSRKPRVGDRVPLSLRVSLEMKRLLEKASDRSGRSLMAEAELLLEMALRAVTPAHMRRPPAPPKILETPSALQPGQVFMRAPAVERLQERRDALTADAHAVIAQADAEDRDLTEAELDAVEGMVAERDKLQRQIAVMQKLGPHRIERTAAAEDAISEEEEQAQQAPSNKVDEVEGE
jgi:TraY domain-containing protein